MTLYFKWCFLCVAHEWREDMAVNKYTDTRVDQHD